MLRPPRLKQRMWSSGSRKQWRYSALFQCMLSALDDNTLLTLDSSLMGQVLGSLILSSYSETFGRKRLYVLSTAIFSIGCIIIPAVPSLAAVVIGRWVTGFVSSIPANVLTGSLEDMYNSQDRLWWMCMIAVASNLGLVLGPLFGVYITTDLGWSVTPCQSPTKSQSRS